MDRLNLLSVALGLACLAGINLYLTVFVTGLAINQQWITLSPTYQSLEIVRALRSRNREVAFVELESNYGHDAFLVEVGEQSELVRGFLDSAFKETAGLMKECA